MPRRTTTRRTPFALSTVALSLLLAILACTANDTLFIRLTATPEPTITPTPLSLETRFKVGDTAIMVGVSNFAGINMPPLPGPFRPGVSGNVTCFPNSKVPIIDISRNTADPNDETIYYLVECPMRGWAADFNLSRFAQYESAVVKSADGSGAKMWRNTDASSDPLPEVCPDGETISIQTLMNNPNNPRDPNIYIQTSCAGQTGFLLESDLAPAS
ncbi:MAG: hypothetical protein IT323_02925 [Anaerolineae bacterium]|nr:hypothetical protein [Anaerolineae bacterium]